MNGTALLRSSPVIVLLAVSSVSGQTDWRHFAANPQRQACAATPPQDLSASLWTAATDSGGLPVEFEYGSAPVVFNGRVYALAKHFVASEHVNNKLLAVETESGQAVFELETLIEPSMYDSWSSPAIDAGNHTVIVGSGHTLYAIDAASGALHWQTALLNPIVNASPTIAEGLAAGRVLITDFDGFGTDGWLYCINTAGFDAGTNPYQPGDIVWQERLGGTSGNSPAYQDGVVFTASVSGPQGGWPPSGVIYAFQVDAPTPETRLLWSWTFDDGEPAAGFFGGVCYADGFIYAATYNFYGSGDNSQLVKLRAADGLRQWVAPCERSDSIPVVSGNRIYLAAGIDGYGSVPKIQAFADNGGSAVELWDTGGAISVERWAHQPILGGNILYAGAIRMNGSPSGPYTDFYRLDVTSAPGNPNFVVEHRQDVGGSAACAAGRIYAIGQDGLHALAAKGDFSGPAGFGDGRVDAADVPGFIDAITSGTPTGAEIALGDFDGDDQLTGADIAGFLAKLLGQ